MSDYRILGIDDSQDTCDCCGKTGLQRVVRLANGDADPVAFGTSCAAMAMRGDKKHSSRMSVASEAGMISMAKKCLSKGFTPKQVGEQIVWSMFAYGSKVRDGKLYYRVNNEWIEIAA